MRSLAVLAFLLLLAPLAMAEEYYADVVLDVQGDGNVAVSGVSNHPLLAEGTTQNLTSKERERWLFNLTIPDKLSEFVIVVRLPDGATLNYVAAKSTVAIGSEGGHVVLRRIGSNSSISLVAQYSLEGRRDAPPLWLQALALIPVIVILLLINRYAAKRRARVATPESRKSELLFEGMQTRQRDIVALLRRNGGVMTQKQLEQALGIPKSSVSRNVESLRRRGVIEKEPSGMTSTVILSEKFR